MFALELVAKLKELSSSGFLVGIKVETESEGMSFSSVARLQVLAAKAGLPLVLKIGGCEAIGDLRNARDLGIDEIVAPMIESAFAAHKFSTAIAKVYPAGFIPKARLLIESVTGLEKAPLILDSRGPEIVGINIGRSDLSSSLQQTEGRSFKVDDVDVLEATRNLIARARERGLEVTVGGKVTPESIGELLHGAEALRPDRFETRRFVFKASALLANPALLDELNFAEVQVAEAMAWTSMRDSQDLHAQVEELKRRYRKPRPASEFL